MKVKLKEDVIVKKGSIFHLSSSSTFQDSYTKDIKMGKDLTMFVVVDSDVISERPDLFEKQHD